MICLMFVGNNHEKEEKEKWARGCIRVIGSAVVMFFSRMREGERNLLGAFVE